MRPRELRVRTSLAPPPPLYPYLSTTTARAKAHELELTPQSFDEATGAEIAQLTDVIGALEQESEDLSARRAFARVARAVSGPRG